MAPAEESAAVTEAATRAVVDKAVDFLEKRHKEVGLEPGFIDRLKVYADRPGWEFIKGPGSPGWDYFVDRIQGLKQEVVDCAHMKDWEHSRLVSKVLASCDWRAWRSDARQRLQDPTKVAMSLDTNRRLRLSSMVGSARVHLFRLLSRFGCLEYLRFDGERIGEHAAEAAGNTSGCTAQFATAEEAERVREAIEAHSAKAGGQRSNFSVDVDRQSNLQPPSRSLLIQSLPDTPERELVGYHAAADFAALFSIFASRAPPAVMHERSRYASAHRQVVVTYATAADAAAALRALQRELAEAFKLETLFIEEEEKTDLLDIWRAADSEVVCLTSGGLQERTELGETELRRIPQHASALDAMQPYREKADGTLERLAAVPADDMRMRYTKLLQQQGVLRQQTDPRVLKHISRKGRDGLYSTDPASDFSVFRVRPTYRFWKETPEGDVELEEEPSPDFAPGNFPALNNPPRAPEEAAPPPAMDLDDEDPLPITDGAQDGVAPAAAAENSVLPDPAAPPPAEAPKKRAGKKERRRAADAAAPAELPLPTDAAPAVPGDLMELAASLGAAQLDPALLQQLQGALAPPPPPPPAPPADEPKNSVLAAVVEASGRGSGPGRGSGGGRGRGRGGRGGFKLFGDMQAALEQEERERERAREEEEKQERRRRREKAGGPAEGRRRRRQDADPEEDTGRDARRRRHGSGDDGETRRKRRPSPDEDADAGKDRRRRRASPDEDEDAGRDRRKRRASPPPAERRRRRRDPSNE